MKKALITLAIITFALALGGGISKVFFNEDTGSTLLLASVIFSAITLITFVFYFVRKDRR